MKTLFTLLAGLLIGVGIIFFWPFIFAVLCIIGSVLGAIISGIIALMCSLGTIGIWICFFVGVVVGMMKIASLTRRFKNQRKA